MMVPPAPRSSSSSMADASKDHETSSIIPSHSIGSSCCRVRHA
jgi:hypothetical protein